MGTAWRPRRLRLATLAVAVTAVHLWLADQHLPARLGDGAADAALRRIDVNFVRELAPAAPAAPAALTPAAAAARRAPPLAAAPEPAASAPDAVRGLTQQDPLPPPLASVESLPVMPVMPLMPPMPEPAIVADQAAAAVASAAAAAAVPAVFLAWPPSTRLSYTLTGNYRGPVQGQAQVEWLRSGSRYQVHLDISVGPSFAPLIRRRISSEGEITDAGLQPRRYDEETKVALREPRRLTIWLDADRVRMPAGTELPRPEGVQDSASQFVQMTWLFTNQPERLRAGQSLSFPLALPRRLEAWHYDVLETETLLTPAGPVEAVHVKPRRDTRQGGDLTAEFWVAPSLQYLPVRILIRQDAQSFVDLLIERLPQQAEHGR